MRHKTVQPIVTLLTDFGSADGYVAQMKLALLRARPRPALVDVSHAIARHDITAASVTLGSVVKTASPRTIHVAVVDPGVGSARRILVVRAAGQIIVCPDNGLITWTHRAVTPVRAFALRYSAPDLHTFHGRDVIAPAVVRLLRGERVERMGAPVDDPVMLDLAPASRDAAGDLIGSRVIHIDAFGNATTNVCREHLPPGATVTVGGQRIGTVRHTYSDVAPGEPLALIGSSGLLEVAVNQGSAAERLGLQVGTAVSVHRV